MPTQTIPIAQIDIPKKWRTIRKKTVAELVMSLKEDGLLHPIGLRLAAKEGRYTLVYGRHRLEGAKKLGWPAIEATVLTGDDLAACAATNAENLFRTGLTPADRVIALKSWSERYIAEHPEVQGQKAGGHAKAAKRQAARTGAAVALVPAFSDHVAQQTGIDKSTVKDHVLAGKKLSDDDLHLLAEREVPLVHVKALAKLPDEAKAKALALIASGLPPAEAIATATLPANATLEMVGDPDAPVRSEADLGDDEWVDTYCGDVLDRLKFQVDYRKDAAIYRHSFELRQKLKTGTKKLLRQSQVQTVGPFYMALTKLINIDHPAKWLPCGPCGGTGQDGNKSQCATCRGHAYGLKYGSR